MRYQAALRPEEARILQIVPTKVNRNNSKKHTIRGSNVRTEDSQKNARQKAHQGLLLTHRAHNVNKLLAALRNF